jgi:cell division protein FtsL
VAKRWLVGGGVWVVVTALAFWLLDPILATFLAILLLTAVVVVALAADWDRHPTFEQRELVRARKRAAKRERTKDARARDRARWEAHQARRAERSGGSR